MIEIKNELNTCPFCGKEARMKVIRDWLRGDKYIPQCTDTKCVGRSTKYYHTEKAAADAWNRRACNAEQ